VLDRVSFQLSLRTVFFESDCDQTELEEAPVQDRESKLQISGVLGTSADGKISHLGAPIPEVVH
jgi:hypothetical protein